MLREGDVSLLNQLVKVLEDSIVRLEEAYNKKDSESFNKLKGTIVQTQRKISGIVR